MQPSQFSSTSTSSPSPDVATISFVDVHVRNCYKKPDVVKSFPKIDRDGTQNLADRLAECMKQLVEPKKKVLDAARHFQSLLREALELVVKRKSSTWQAAASSSSATATVQVEVRKLTKEPSKTANFSRCSINSAIDIGVVLTSMELPAKLNESVIGVCQVKTRADSVDTAIRQQLSATLTKQRSVRCVEADGDGDGRRRWRLPGLVVYADKAFITQLETGDWWHFTADLKSVQRFDFSSASVSSASSLCGTGRRRLQTRVRELAGVREENSECAYELLGVLSAYADLLFGDGGRFNIDTAFCDVDDLPYFSPPDTKPLHGSHIVRCKYETVRTRVIEGDKRWTRWITWNHVNDDEDVVVKTMTTGLYRHANTAESRVFLLVAAGSRFVKLRSEMMEGVRNRMRDLGLDGGDGDDDSLVSCFSAIEHLHLWTGCMPDSRSRAIVTRFVGDAVCVNRAVLELWKTDGGASRKRFYDQVCEPALKLVAHGYFHGDIRPPNVAARVVDEAAQFTLIDWDDVRTIYETRSVERTTTIKGADGVETEVVTNDYRYPSLPHVADDAKRSLLFTACQLYVTALIIDRVAMTGEDAVELEANGRKKKFWDAAGCSDCTWKLNFWAAHRSVDTISARRETHFDELVGAMEDGGNESGLGEHLIAILKAALQI